MRGLWGIGGDAGVITHQQSLSLRQSFLVELLSQRRRSSMSKGMNQKREQKRKPAKTLDEKRAAKKAKKAERAAGRTL
jgi:hypothetical protein